MTYNPGVPKASDTLSQSQPPFLVNFGQLDTIFSLDHIEYAAATVASRGRHKKITFNDAAGDPNLAKPISALYTKGAVGGPMQLFFQNDTLAANIVKLTGLTIGTVANGGTAGGTIHTIDTPWGFRIYLGTTAAFVGSAKTVIFPVAFTTNYTAVASANDGNPVAVSCLKSTGLLAIGTANNVSVNWFTIGVL